MKLSLQVETDDPNSTSLPMYMTVNSAGTVHKTREFAGGRAFVDFDVNGLLVGIELLGPCSIVVNISDQICRKSLN